LTLQDKNVPVRRKAAWALGMIGPFAKTAVPDLLKLLDDPDPGDLPKELGVRALTVQALGNIGPDAKETLPLLQKIAQAENDSCRGLALEAITQIAPEKSLLQPCLRGLKDAKVCAEAVKALGYLGPDAKEAVPALLEILKHPPVQDKATLRQLRQNVVWTLRQIGPDAREAIPTLRELASAPDINLSNAAHLALRIIAPK
jgi:HEAT repeat protein